MGKFLDKSRGQKINSPISDSFSFDIWRQEYEKNATDLVDEQLYTSGIFFAKKYLELRKIIPEISTSMFESESKFMIILIGAINFNTLITKDEIEMNIIQKGEPLIFSDLQSFRLSGPFGSLRIEDYMSALVDMGEALLKIKDDLLKSRNPEKVNIEQQLSKIFCFIQSRNSLYYSWLKSLWENYCIVKHKDRYLFISADREFAKSHSIGIARRESSQLNMCMTCLNIYNKNSCEYPKLEIKRVGKKRRYFVLKETEPRNFSSLAMRIIASENYYDELFTRKFNWKGYSLSVNLIFDVWEQIYRVAQKEAETLPDVKDNKDHVNLKQYCRLIPQHELKKFLSIVCNNPVFAPGILDAIIDFLTFEKSKSIWNAPLIPVIDKGIYKYAFFVTSILHADTLKVVEKWLKQAEIQVSEKGVGYEDFLRNRLEKALNENSLISNKKVYHLNKRHIDEEIDIVFIIDKFLFVGEAKCFVTPTSSVEIYNFKNKVRDAVRQINRKKKVVEKKIDKIAEVLGCNLDNSYTVVPFFISNVNFYSGVIYNEVILTDLDILFYYLKGGVKKQAIDGTSNSPVFEQYIRFYETEKEAAEKFTDYLSNPIQKKCYKCSHQNTNVFPAFTSNDFDIFECEYIANLQDPDFDKIANAMKKDINHGLFH